MSWTMLGSVSPTALVDARLQAHHAAQIVASAGATFLEAQPDDSHPNFVWSETHQALVGRVLPGANAQVGLRVADLSLILIDNKSFQIDSLSLDNKTLEEGYAWLSLVTADAGALLPKAGLTRSAYEIPGHAIRGGAPLHLAKNGSFDELARWFANGHHALERTAANTQGASEVRCWPHHFDIGSLVTLATHPDGRLRKSIGIGLSPGDEGYDEPYLYVSPWPYPAPAALPALERGGHWHTEGHTSAILTATELLEGRAAEQGERLDAFLADAIGASERALAD